MSFTWAGSSKGMATHGAVRLTGMEDDPADYVGYGEGGVGRRWHIRNATEGREGVPGCKPREACERWRRARQAVKSAPRRAKSVPQYARKRRQDSEQAASRESVVARPGRGVSRWWRWVRWRREGGGAAGGRRARQLKPRVSKRNVLPFHDRVSCPPPWRLSRRWAGCRPPRQKFS